MFRVCGTLRCSHSHLIIGTRRPARIYYIIIYNRFSTTCAMGNCCSIRLSSNEEAVTISYNDETVHIPAKSVEKIYFCHYTNEVMFFVTSSHQCGELSYTHSMIRIQHKPMRQFNPYPCLWTTIQRHTESPFKCLLRLKRTYVPSSRRGDTVIYCM